MSEFRPRARRSSRAPGIARHGRLKAPNPFGTILKFLAASVAVLMVSGASVAAITLVKFDSNIKTVTLANETDGPPPSLGAFDGGFNVLLVGSDSRAGSGEKGPDSALNDVNILLHVSQDQTNAVAVSIPRDMIVPIPSCPKENGKGNYGAMSAQPLNSIAELRRTALHGDHGGSPHRTQDSVRRADHLPRRHRCLDGHRRCPGLRERTVPRSLHRTSRCRKPAPTRCRVTTP